MPISSVCHQSSINGLLPFLLYLALFPHVHMYVLLKFLLIYKIESYCIYFTTWTFYLFSARYSAHTHTHKSGFC